MEVSAVTSKAESSLMYKRFHEICTECRSTQGDLGDLLHNDGCVSRLNMPIDSTNTLDNEFLDKTSIGTAVTEALIDISDDQDNLEVENNLINKLFKEL